MPLRDGHLKVVDDITELPGPLAAASSFGFGGSNGHVLLKRNEKQKINHGIPKDGLPRLVCWSGRTEKASSIIFDEICKRPLDAEFVGLLHNCQTQSVLANMVRGYGVFKQPDNNNNNAVCAAKEIERFSGTERPLVLVFSGMGSQWLEMGSSLMTLPMIRESIERSHKILETQGLNLIQILTSPEKSTYDNILHSFVGIAAIQIALVDTLKMLNVKPDYIVGHSVGELGCAYADGCFTAEEMILSAYSRGMASIETEVIFGSMAAIGLGYQDIRAMLVDGIEVACHNGPNSCTISGPADLVSSFVKNLTNKGIFAREVPCSNIPYHSSYIKSMGPKLLSRLKKVIKNPKQRSSKWLSSSVPEENWNNPESQYCSAEYQTNNLLSSVLFEETIKLLPENSVTIEIAPHGLLQAILKTAMPDSIHIKLTQRQSDDNISVFFAGLGKLYNQGFDLPVNKLYPPVEFPVSVGTPMISPLISAGWEHTDDHMVIVFDDEHKKHGAEQQFQVNIGNKEFQYITGHKIDGRILYPATGYLCLAWEAFAYTLGPGIYPENTPVEITDVKFLQATPVNREKEIKFIVVIHPATGRFEIVESGTAIVTGSIRKIEQFNQIQIESATEESTILKTSDFYKELKLRGYHYDNEFRSVLECRSDALGGKIQWRGNFVPLMDCMLQIGIIGIDSRSLMVPTGIDRVKIDPQLFLDSVKSANDDPEMKYADIVCSKALKVVQTKGIEIHGMSANVIQRRKPPSDPVLESYKYIPYFEPVEMCIRNAMRTFVQLGLENMRNMKLKVIELDDGKNEPIIPYIQMALEELPTITAEFTLLSNNSDHKMHDVTIENNGKLAHYISCDFIAVPNICTDPGKIENMITSCKEHTFIISRESIKPNISKLQLPASFNCVSLIQVGREFFVLIQYCKKKTVNPIVFIRIPLDDNEFTWIPELKNALKMNKICLFAQGEPLNGIIGLANCLNRESKLGVQCIFIDDRNAPPFDPELPLYAKQINQNLAINVYRNGIWGSYRHLLLNLEVPAIPHEDHCYANALTYGNLSSLTWLEGPIDAADKNAVAIHYASLNFRDVMIATGKLDLSYLYKRIEQTCILGFEYSGIRKMDGKRIMGIGNSGAMATYIYPDEHAVWDVPDHWSLSEAASVLCVYCTVYAAFFDETVIEKGKKILIHAGTGGIGLSAIRIALAYGLEVFTTVSTPEKKQFLLEQFPELRASHIGNSRDTSFYEMVMVETDGEGVDYVLNSLAEDKLITSLKCLAQNGHFLEIGKYDILRDSKIGLGHFEKNITFHVIMLDATLKKKEVHLLQKIHKLIQRDIDRGIIVPLKTTIFEASEIEKAFRYLASGKHKGKLLLKIRNQEKDKHSVPIAVLPQIYCKPNKSYVIAGGLGGFGLELADWLVLRGCTHLVFSSSRGISKPYQEYRINLWKSYGVKVIVSTDDISTHQGCLNLIQLANSSAPVAAIFNLAVLLRDDLFENQNAQTFKESLSVKAYATRYLDEISRKLCPSLEHFVVFSSVSCGRGNEGQTNYGLANSIMERIIESRVTNGYPGKAIQWGAVGEVGLVADMAENKIDMKIGGTLQQRISNCLQVMDGLLSCPDPIVASMVVAEKQTHSGGGVIDSILNIIGVKDLKSVSMDQKLSDLGMDSLMAVEIKQTIERDFDIALPPQELRVLTFGRLIELANASTAEKKEISVNTTSLSLLFRNLGNEKESDEILLRLKTKEMGENTRTPIIFIPGIEGVAGSIWHELASKIDSEAYILQYKETADATNVSSIVDLLFEDTLKLIGKNSKTYCLAGYSFGTLIGLEIAKRLEDLGYNGKVIFIDGAPLWAQKSANNMFTVSNDDQDGLLRLALGSVIMATFKIPTSPAELMKIKSWEEMAEQIYEMYSNKAVYSKEYCCKIMQGIYNRLKIALKLDADKFLKVKSNIVLIRPVEPLISEIEEDYGLQKCTSGDVAVKFIEGNHMTILESMDLIEILNQTM